jgi:hypothetical protein
VQGDGSQDNPGTSESSLERMWSGGLVAGLSSLVVDAGTVSPAAGALAVDPHRSLLRMELAAVHVVARPRPAVGLRQDRRSFVPRVRSSAEHCSGNGQQRQVRVPTNLRSDPRLVPVLAAFMHERSEGCDLTLAESGFCHSVTAPARNVGEL